MLCKTVNEKLTYDRDVKRLFILLARAIEPLPNHTLIHMVLDSEDGMRDTEKD